jgi:hypothetical protein
LDNRATGDECANQVSLLVFQLPVNEEDLVAHVVRGRGLRGRGMRLRYLSTRPRGAHAA